MTRRRVVGLFTLAGTAVALPACGSPGGDADTPLPARGRLGSQVQEGSVSRPTPTTVWSFQPRDPDKAPFRLEIAGREFNGTFDSVMYLGYNTAGTGRRVVRSEPAFRWAIEQDYNDGEKRLVESYFEFAHKRYDRHRPPLGPSRRTIMWQFDRETGQIHRFELRGRQFTFSDWDTGTRFASWSKAGLTLGGTLATNQSLALRAPDGYSSSLVMEHGGFSALNISAINRGNVHVAVANQPTLFLFARRMGVGVEDNRAALSAQDAFGADVIVARQGPSTQRGDLFAARDEGGERTYWRVGSAGHMVVGATAAPPDDGLRSGEVGIWLDPGPAAPRVMFKAKDARGEVRVASLALT